MVFAARCGSQLTTSEHALTVGGLNLEEGNCGSVFDPQQIQIGEAKKRWEPE